MEEKIKKIQIQISQIESLISEVNELKKITEKKYQETIFKNSEKIKKLKALAEKKCKILSENDPKRDIIKNKIKLFEENYSKKSQEFLSEIKKLTQKINKYANESAILTKQMIEIYSEGV